MTTPTKGDREAAEEIGQFVYGEGSMHFHQIQRHVVLCSQIIARHTRDGELREALKNMVTMCEGLAALGFVHKGSDSPIEFSPDGPLAIARALLARLDGELLK